MVNLLRPLTSLPMCVFSSGEFFQICGSFQLLHESVCVSVCAAVINLSAIRGIVIFFK